MNVSVIEQSLFLSKTRDVLLNFLLILDHYETPNQHIHCCQGIKHSARCQLWCFWADPSYGWVFNDVHADVWFWFERMSQQEWRETAHIITADKLKQSCHKMTCSIIKWPSMSTRLPHYRNCMRELYWRSFEGVLEHHKNDEKTFDVLCRHQCYYH